MLTFSDNLCVCDDDDCAEFNYEYKDDTGATL